MALRIPLDEVAEGERDLGEEASRYLLRVHRLRTGDTCVAFDPSRGQEADLEIVATRKNRARIRLTSTRASTRVATRPITVIQGLSKGSKVEAMVRDATELGATRIVIARCERSVKRDADVARCRRVALEAARQCGRGDVPEVEGPSPFLEVVRAMDGVGVLLDPQAPRALGAVIKAAPRAHFIVAIGPEGGFSEPEKQAAIEGGFVTARLGPFVLRTETACAAALGAIAAAPISLGEMSATEELS